MMIKIILSLLLLMSFSITCFAEKTIYLTSLNWSPYSGKTLKNQGASVAVAKAAFKSMGYTLVVDFYPWSRAVNLSKDPNSKYVGYFPEYHSDDIAKKFIFSDEMGTGPLGFAQQIKKPVAWETLDDLKQYKVGVVRDYVNTKDFDARMSDGKIKTEATNSDKQNLQKISSGRLDLAVIDKNVMNYLFKNDKSLSNIKSSISFNEKLLEEKKLYICFKKGAKGEQLTKIFNDGMKKIDWKQIMKEHID